MVTPIEESEDVQEEEVIAEVVISSASKSKDKPTFDFAVDNTDRSGLMVYTVCDEPTAGDWKSRTIRAPHYGAALEMAGIGKGNTIKVSEAPFEG